MRCTIFTFIRRFFQNHLTKNQQASTLQNKKIQSKQQDLLLDRQSKVQADSNKSYKTSFKTKKANKTEAHTKKISATQTNSNTHALKLSQKVVYPRSVHSISRREINVSALKVLNRLNSLGYEAYLVGGCVRDLLLHQKPKDFDIATNATPEQVQKAFRNCRLIGRRFRLAHILFGREIIEVATFRSGLSEDSKYSSAAESGLLLRDNVYGTIEEDAQRRDFTVNSLYYNIQDFSIVDYCHGMEDLEKGVIRLIGDPVTRYREDPVRMLRAIRFSAKLSMPIAPETEAPMFELMPLLKQIPSARLFDETLKLLQSGYGAKCYPLLIKYQVFPYLLPALKELNLAQESSSKTHKMMSLVLKNTDKRLAQDLKVNPAFLYAAILWYPLTEQAQLIADESGLSYHDAFNLAMNEILTEQCRVTAIPKRITTTMSDIWRLQLRFNRLTPKKIEVTLEQPKFRAAYDLLLLRSEFESDSVKQLATWWTEYQVADEEQQQKLKKEVAFSSERKRRTKKHFYTKSKIKTS